jgi:hypothetical protein
MSNIYTNTVNLLDNLSPKSTNIVFADSLVANGL